MIFLSQCWSNPSIVDRWFLSLSSKFFSISWWCLNYTRFPLYPDVFFSFSSWFISRFSNGLSLYLECVSLYLESFFLYKARCCLYPWRVISLSWWFLSVLMFFFISPSSQMNLWILMISLYFIVSHFSIYWWILPIPINTVYKYKGWIQWIV